MRYESRIIPPILILITSCIVPNTEAAIISTGEVNPDGLGPGDTTASSVTVGGDFTSSGTGQLTINDGSTLTTPSPIPYGNIAPLEGSAGSVTVSGGGADGTPSTWRLEGEDSEGNGAFLTIGRGGSGSLTIEDGGRVEIDSLGADVIRGDVFSPFPAGFQVGRSELSSGTVNITGSDSELALTSELAFGRIGHEGSGTMNITDGARLSYSGVSSDLNVASGVGTTGTGILNIQSGGQVDGPVFLDVGAGSGSTGTVSLSGSDSSINLRGACTPDCPEGYSFPNQGAFMTVGADQGTGNVTVSNGATITIDSSDTPGVPDAEFPGFQLGGSTIHGPEGNGTLTVEGLDSQVLVRGDQGFFSVGRLENGAGTLNIREGGSVIMENADGQSTGFVGDRPGATGTIAVDGNGSVLDAGNFLGVGVTQTEGDAGNGLIQLSDGALVKADELVVGNGGTLAGNGTVSSSTGVTGQTRVNRGLIDPGLSTGELEFDGDLILEEGTILLEADSPDDFDQISVTENLILAGGMIDILLGFVPDTGFLFNPFSVAGTVEIDDAFGGARVLGDVGIDMQIGDQLVRAESTQVPLPGSFTLLLAGLLGWLFGGRWGRGGLCRLSVNR